MRSRLKLLGSRNSLKPSDALRLLSEVGCSQKVVSHLIAVSKHAKELALKIRSKGHEIDVDFVETAALLHDIGRCRTHGIRHGVEGARILRERGLEDYARVCETHIGAGLSKEEAESLDLPPGDYIPKTLEEKIIAHADNLVEGERVVSIDRVLERLGERLGKEHPALKRAKELSRFIESLS